MNKKLIQAIGAGVTATTLSAFAGDMAVTPPAPVNNGNWCDALQGIGTIYKDKNNPYIQEIKVFGRAHYQFSSTDGEYNGTDFDSNGGELRRLRFGTSIKFLNDFKLVGRGNFEEGEYRNDEIGYDSMDELYLEYGLGDFAGFEDVTIGYGRYKVAFGGEEHISSKKIKTVERSNINNFYAPRRSTGFLVGASRGDIDLTVGIFSTDRDQTLGQWDQGVAYYASAGFEALSGNVTVDFIYNDANPVEDQTFGYEWATSVTHQSEFGNWDLFLNATYGETHAGSNVYGVVVMPSTFLIEDKLEAVVRYQYAASDAVDGFSINSRNVRNAAGAHRSNTQIASGDENHTLYAGLNYYLCDHNAKVMVGVEYETLDGGTAANPVDLEATTLWAAFRMYF
ncbi:OprO/OprP family phosphate-selective porin [bacterium]|nr:OprO/OprP family phosphate-selective porin [Akkermansiaceae bacterium]MDB4262476.1 OprO/OprP family phosphate-selective porin [bacterium]MDB4282840.1 OprO/OprP family phosphate-selective porin [Akkermansiaceae bacterium]MDB4630757.1 OprO/OprP family phosphate-selective porin [Akkermansiaceae bacterium]